ncbi:MAG TPA: nucleoside monophosphate kinase, partial [Paludibacteraceae bacterium]|nr:nucleoside monophosphate kinase [Paludibacteraceae bacterium]
MLNLVIFGAPGSGKGTQSELIAKKYNLVHLSTGDLLRKEIAEQTELGKLAKGIIDQGKLVSDDVIINLLESNIAKYPNANGFIFDGFPRTVVQA